MQDPETGDYDYSQASRKILVTDWGFQVARKNYPGLLSVTMWTPSGERPSP